MVKLDIRHLRKVRSVLPEPVPEVLKVKPKPRPFSTPEENSVTDPAFTHSLPPPPVSRWLLVDDVRDLNCHVTARTPQDARQAIQEGGFTHMVFDHDLAAEETGYDILKWAAENDLLSKKVQLCTSNPVGRANMVAVLTAHDYVREVAGLDMRWFKA